MNDLIDRQAAINNIKNGFHWETVNGITAQAVLKQVIHDIEIMPSAQPEQKKGKWVRWYEEIERDTCKEFIPHCKCSECGTDINTRTTLFIKFCPYCGADMRGDKH